MTKRVFVSVDMEGVAGIATLDQILRGGSGYPRAQALMTDEASAAVRGAFAAGADEVVVNDSHGTMDNLLHDRLDPRARLLFGAPRPSCMVQGISPGDALAVFVGYHAAAGADGVLSHTFSSNFTEVRVNGAPVSEAEVNGVYAASAGVPVGVVTGDDQICEVARKVFPGVTTVEVKRSVAYTATDSLAPQLACDRIEQAVAEAVSRAGELKVTPPPDMLTVAIDFTTPLAAEIASSVPGSIRVAPRTLQRQVRNADELIRLIMAWYYLAAIAAQEWAAIAHRR